ncbi:MAG: NB-ARC domain-containing protein [Cyanobacteria bacterium P01_B01_bin.77]
MQRPEHFEAVKARLLDESTPGTLVISAIYGMGGIGKSVLAAALVQNDEIQQRFPDGVLWVTLGQQPDMLSMVNLWIRELGDYDYNPTTLQAASLHLRTLLADRKALLVIDDVWHPEHVEPFRIAGAGCRVLVTTRQTKIVGATRYDLDLMTQQQSLELLTRCLPTPLSEAEKSSAETFAKEVGYLPLALELAAAQIEDGVTWDELLEAFQSEMADPEALDIDSDVASLSDETIRKRRSLVASFKLTLKLLSPKQLEQFAWFGIVPEDVSLTQQMAATLWGVKPIKAGKLLRGFKNRALLLPQAQRTGEKPTYRIHDLVHDFAKNLLTSEQYLGDLSGLGLPVETAHSQFLERYQDQTKDGLWHTVPADGYIHSHLVWHFEQSGQPGLIHQLLKESTSDGRNGWYEICEQLGQTANFVTDTARAWQAAGRLYEQNVTESIALQCRYALITTSLNSLVQNLPPTLTAALVQKGLWQPAQGLAYVRQSPYQFIRAEGLKTLVPYLPGALMKEALVIARSIEGETYRAYALCGVAEYVPEILKEALVMARSIEDETYRARVLSLLAPYLPEVLEEALLLTHSIKDEMDRASVLSSLIPHLPGSLMPDALAIVSSIQHELSRANALSWVAPYLSEFLIRDALSIVRSIQHKSEQAYALSLLAPYLPEIASEALSMTPLIQPGYLQSVALSSLAPYLPDSLTKEALAVARSIQHERPRIEALRSLAPYLPGVLEEALAIARSIPDEHSRADALMKFVPDVPEVLEEVLSVACLIEEESERANILIEVAPYLPQVVREAWMVACSIQNAPERIEALEKLAEYVPEPLMKEILVLARSIQDKLFQAGVLIELVEYLPEVISEAFTVARSIQDNYSRAKALSWVAQYVPEGIHEALAATRLIQSEKLRNRALSELVMYLPEVVGEALAIARSIQDRLHRESAMSWLIKYIPAKSSEALEIARSIQDEYYRAKALSWVAEYMPEVRTEALEVARSIQKKYFRANVLNSMAKYMPEVRSEALVAVRAIEYKSLRIKALSALAEYMPELTSEALEAVFSMQSGYDQAEAIVDLAPYLPESLLPKAIEITRSIQGECYQAEAIRGLAPYLPELLLPKIIEMAHSIQDEYYRAKALSGLVHMLKTIETDFDAWQNLVHTLAYQDRQFFLTNIPKLAPAIISLSGGGTKALELVVEAMQDVCHQWP